MNWSGGQRARQKVTASMWVVIGLMLIAGMQLIGLGLISANDSAFWLVTPEEASMTPALSPKDDDGSFRLGASPDNGPIVNVERPALQTAVTSPLEIIIRFAPRQAAVDVSSLKVTLVKFVNIDITPRIKPFTTSEGIHIQDVNLPSGTHRVRLVISDKSGKLTVKELKIQVI